MPIYTYSKEIRIPSPVWEKTHKVFLRDPSFTK